MAKDNYKEKEQKDAYKTTSNNLQNAVLIFLGLLLFVSLVILFPYYFLADIYKVGKNMEFHAEKINEHLESVEDALQNYRAKNQNYLDSVEKINTNITKIYNHSLIVPTYDTCDSIKNTTESIDCIVKAYSEDRRNKSLITIDNYTILVIKDKIPMIQKIIDEISKENITREVNANLTRLNKIITDIGDNITKNDTMDLTLTSFDKLFNPIYTYSNQSVNEPINDIMKKVQNETSEFKKRVESVEYPIIGKVPLSLSQFFLSFPTVIGIGFSFISLQFKSLISIHKELGLDNDGDKAFLSWLDPLQRFPEKAYPLIIMALPCILFGVSFWFIYSIYYINVEYPQDFSSLTTDDPLVVPQNITDVVIALNLFVAALFGYSYYQIIKAWRTR